VRVLIAAGGTGGHVSPALALARELADEHGADVRFAGAPQGQEARLVAAAGFPFLPVQTAPFVRGASARNLTGLVVVLRSVDRSRGYVQDADVVVGMGGYASAPVGVAALRARRPLVVHEQNAIPGLANRLFARGARAVALSFADTVSLLPRRTRSVVTGNPVRSAIVTVRQDRDRLGKEAHEVLELEPGRRTIVVFGGSQGARRVGQATVDATRELADRDDLQFLLLTGPTNLEAVREAIPSGTASLVRVLPFLDRMELAYAAADLVVCRAGASSVAEVAVCGLPSVLVPYPFATRRHQDANARALYRAGGAVVVADDVLSGALLAARLKDLLGDPVRLAEMGKHAAAWARPDAARALADVVAGAAR
jgi:UDP-N-acetylglucosamine--N-acetylmuramyl-(pentapeptide) pyrophosphoryl-undecaprenol N-acetylglucosamine transferase